jgi:hypothetical protein
MKSLKALFAVAVVTAAALSTTGCSGVGKFIEDGQARYDANPAAYEAITGHRAYFEVNPVTNNQGS